VEVVKTLTEICKAAKVSGPIAKKWVWRPVFVYNIERKEELSFYTKKMYRNKFL